MKTVLEYFTFVLVMIFAAFSAKAQGYVESLNNLDPLIIEIPIK